MVYISRGILDNYEMQWRARTCQDHNSAKMYVMYLCTYAVACILVPVYASSNPCLSSFQRALKYGHAYNQCSCSCIVLLPSCLNVLLTARPCAQIRPPMVTWAPKYTCTRSHGRPNTLARGHMGGQICPCLHLCCHLSSLLHRALQTLVRSQLHGVTSHKRNVLKEGFL